MTPQGRLIVVSNRLPVTAIRSENATELHNTDGRLVSARIPILSPTGGCCGWTGGERDENLAASLRSFSRSYDLEPVFLTAGEKASFNQGLSNE